MFVVVVACGQDLEFPGEPELLGEVRFALRNAFEVWSDVTLLEFSEVHRDASDITIEFATGQHLDGYPFDGQGVRAVIRRFNSVKVILPIHLSDY